MITLVFIQMIHIVLVQLLDKILPVADPALLTKFTETFSWLVNNFMSLGYYYLPVSAISFAVGAVVDVWLLSFGIKFALKLTHIITGGIVKTDNL